CGKSGAPRSAGARAQLEHRGNRVRDDVAGRRLAALAHDVERGDAVRLGQGREVEYVLDVGVDFHFGREAELADVHELGGAVARDLHADHAAATGIGDELQ